MTLRIVLRGLGRTPLFTVAAIATLVLGIGANTAIFSAVEAVLLHPVAAPDLDRVVAVESELPSLNLHRARVAPAEVGDLAAKTSVFEAVGGYRDEWVELGGDGEPQRIQAASTVGDFFGTFGVKPVLGRLYDASDVKNGNTRVVVMAYDAWHQLQGGDRAAIGRVIRLSGESFQLVGVLPPGFRFPRETQLFTPHPLDFGVEPNARGILTVNAFARLRRDVTPTQVAAVLSLMHTELMRQYPALYPAGIPKWFGATPFTDAIAGQLRPILLLLTAAVVFVLLTACSNVASLQLVRTIGRTKEIAVRRALGASGTRLVVWLSTESLLIAIAGGALGVLAASAAIAYVRASDAPELAMLKDIRLNSLVLWTSVGVTMTAALLFGVAPALRTLRIDPSDAMRGGPSRGSSSGAQHSRFLRAVIVTQFALALILLIGSTVALRSTGRLLGVDPGFRADGLLAARLALPETRYRTERALLDFHDRVLARLQSNPSTQHVATVVGAPFVSVKEIEHARPVREAGHDAKDFGPLANLWIVGGDYFGVMGIPIRAGVAFDDTDDALHPSRVILDDVLARAVFPGQSALGKQLADQMGSVIGIVGSVKKADLSVPLRGSVYVPARRAAGALSDFTILVRSDNPADVKAMLRTAIHDVDPEIPIPAVVTMRGAIDRSLGVRRMASAVLGAFAALSIILAMLGVHGVMSYAISQQMKEFAIRLALGAAPPEITRMVLLRGGSLALRGIAAGVVVYLAGSGLLSSLAYGVSARDPLVAAAAALALACVGIGATWWPARRASRANPVHALRAE